MKRLVTAVLSGALMGAASAHAAASERVTEMARPTLSEALDRLSERTGAIIIAPGGILEGRDAPPRPRGGSTEQQLAALLENSGLTFTRTRPNVFVVSAIAAPAAEPEAPASTIVVTGRYFGSLMTAADRERRSDTLIEAIDAQSVGDFPAQNLAEALQRVTGVSVTQDRGEAVFVRVRGLAANFQIVTLNGGSVAVNENVRDSGQDGRQFRFDVIPTDLVAGVEVIKAPSADVEEGAVGAVINVRTFQPLDLPAGGFTARGGVSRPELSGTSDLRAAAIGSWRSPNRDFGALLGLSYVQRSVRQDRITQSEWEEVSVGGQRVLAPSAYRPTLEREDRERVGVNGVLQYRPGDRTELGAEAFYVRLGADYHEATYSADFDHATLTDVTVRDGAVVAGLAHAASQIGIEQSSLVHDNLYLSLTAAHDVDDTLSIRSRVSHTRANSFTDQPITRTRLMRADVGAVRFAAPDLFAGAPDIRFLETDLADPAALPFRRIELRNQDSRDAETAADVKLTRAVGAAPLREIEFGYRYRHRSRAYDRRDRVFDGAAGQYFPDAVFDPFPVDDFLADAGGDLVRRWALPNPSAVADAVGFTPTFSAPTAADLRNSYEVREEIQSAYALARFEHGFGAARARGGFGVRVSGTRQTSSGHVVEKQQALPVTFSTTYFDVLPSANVAVELDPFLFRASLARVIARPSLADLAPRITLNSGVLREAVGGNPTLGRYEAWQADLAQEVTFAETGSFSAGVFYKKFDTFIYDQISNLTIGGIDYRLTAPANGGDAEVYGLELSYQQQFNGLPAPFDGLGAQANYTRVKSEATYSNTVRDQLADLAEETFSVGAIYEQGPVQARVIYNHSGDVLTAVGVDNALSNNQARFGTLDANLTFQVTPNFDLTIEAQNLTDEAQYLFARDDLFAGYTAYGRTFAITARVRSGAWKR